jgi:tripartite-type tricarboxylate transporter receptor subunit TctC
MVPREAVVRVPADGYTLLMANTAAAINATLYEKLNFDFIRDMAPVAAVMRGGYVVEVHPPIPAKTLPEFIAYAKANPGKINMGMSGSGASEAQGASGRAWRGQRCRAHLRTSAS